MSVGNNIIIFLSWPTCWWTAPSPLAAPRWKTPQKGPHLRGTATVFLVLSPAGVVPQSKSKTVYINNPPKKEHLHPFINKYSLTLDGIAVVTMHPKAAFLFSRIKFKTSTVTTVLPDNMFMFFKPVYTGSL